MDALAIATTIIGAIQMAEKYAPIVIDGVSNAKTFAVQLWTQLTGTAPTAEQEAQIDALLAVLTTRLEVPLPAAQPGDPDFIG